MNCIDFLKEWMTKDTLSEEAAQHMHTCSFCIKKTMQYEATMQCMRELKPPKKIDVTQLVMEQIQNHKVPVSKRNVRKLYVSVISIAASFTLLLLILMKSVMENPVQNDRVVADMFAEIYATQEERDMKSSYSELAMIEYFFDEFDNVNQ